MQSRMRQLLVSLLARYMYKPNQLESYEMPLNRGTIAVSPALPDANCR